MTSGFIFNGSALFFLRVSSYLFCITKLVFMLCSGWMLEVWQNYISMELLLGNVKETRTLYKRCYSRRLEGAGTEVRTI